MRRAQLHKRDLQKEPPEAEDFAGKRIGGQETSRMAEPLNLRVKNYVFLRIAGRSPEPSKEEGLLSVLTLARTSAPGEIRS